MANPYINQVAQSVPFESEPTRLNGFPDTVLTTQDAIEYAKQNAEGFPRAGIPLIFNGTAGNGDWISYSNLTPNVPIIFPVKTKLSELTWANNNGDRDFDLEFYEQDGTTYIDKLEVRNSPEKYGYFENMTYIFDAGTGLRIKYIDQGKNCKDLCVVLWISRIV